MKKIFLSIIFITLIITGSKAWAITELPDPNTEIIPGYTIAAQRDDFYAYSAKLNTLIGLEGFDFSTGTGGLDLLLYTGAGGATNEVDISGNPQPEYTFEDPMDAPAGSETNFTGTWGIGLQDDGPVYVDDLSDYLHDAFGADVDVPVFYFDMAQAAGKDDHTGLDLYVAGKVSIWDPDANEGAGAEIAFWAFDNIENNVFDIPDLTDITDAAWVKAEGSIDLGVDLNGDNVVDGKDVVDHNAGNGKADYIAFAPTMDLSLYLNQGYQFKAQFYLSGLTNGPEELFLTGAFAPPCPPEQCPGGNVVPEPASMLLMGGGLVGLVALRRRKV